MSEELEGKHGVQSLEVGMSILRAMANGQRSMMLKDIAAAADMPASKAHRYLVSLIRAGETSGTMGQVFLHLSESIKWQDELSSKAKTIMLYPAFVGTVVIGVAFFDLLPEALELATPFSTSTITSASSSGNSTR